MDKTGYVYIITDGAYHKVGRCSDMVARLAFYKRQLGYVPTVLYNRFVLDRFAVESRLIAYCQNYPKKGKEWFRVPRRKVHRLVRFIESQAVQDLGNKPVMNLPPWLALQRLH